MQVAEINAEGLKRDFKVVIPASEIDENVNTRLSEIAKTAQLPGFRPGKAPVALLRKNYGHAFMGEILEKKALIRPKGYSGQRFETGRAAENRSHEVRRGRRS